MENVTRKEIVLTALAPWPAHALAALAPTRTRKIEDD